MRDGFNRVILTLITALFAVGIFSQCNSPSSEVSLSSPRVVGTSSSALEVPVQAPGQIIITSLGRDQTDQIQKTLDALAVRGGGEIVFRPGPNSNEILLVRQTPYSYALKGKDLSHVTWRCEGGVVFRRIEPAIGASKDLDFASLWLEDSHDVRFENCSWDGGLREFVQGEQSHHIDIRANKAEVYNVWVIGNDFGYYEGDGVRLLGGSDHDGPLVRDIYILSNSMHDNLRSGVGVQRGVQRVLIQNNLCWNNSDQCIDFEPSGKNSLPVRWIIIRGNWFGPNQSLALTIAGTKRQPDMEARAVRDILVEGNIFGGGVNIIWARDVTIRGNQITTRGDKSPAILINGEVQRVSITDNELVAPADGTKEAVSITSVHGEEIGSDVVIQGNRIRGPKNKGVVVRTMNRVVITDNEIEGSIILEAEKPVSIRDFKVMDNTIRDPDTCLRLLGRDNGLYDVLVDGNWCRAPRFEDIRGDVQGVILGTNWGGK